MNFVIELKRNNEDILKEVYEEYHHVLYSYVYKKTRSEYYAEEIVQITFFKLWKYRNSLNENIPIINQLFRIARTSLINLLKKSSLEKAYTENYQNTKEGFYNNVSQEILFNETQSKLEQLISSLPPVRKKVFELSRKHALSYKEIAEILSISPKTVENHINLALRYIKPFFFYLLLIGYYFQR